MEIIQAYETIDGKLFTSKESAERHEDDLSKLEEANRLLEERASVGSILDKLAYGSPDPVLYSVNKDTGLIISHWQCSEKPGYRPLSFNEGLASMFVGGDVGAWTGAYYSDVSITNLVRYAKLSKKQQ